MSAPVRDCQACGAPFKPASAGENVCPICVVEIRTRRQAALELKAFPPERDPDESDRRRGPKPLIESRPSENRRRQRARGSNHPPMAGAVAWGVSSVAGAILLCFESVAFARGGIDGLVALALFAMSAVVVQSACLYFALAAYWSADRPTS